MKETAAVIMAAGKGTRMKSALPKIMHPICGKPMISYALDMVMGLGIKNIFVIVSPNDLIQNCLANKAVLVEQKEQLGTGHALQQVLPHLESFEGDVIVLSGDMPLLTPKDLETLLKKHRSHNSSVTVLSAIIPWATDFGRIIRNFNGSLLKIVEARDATPEELKTQEVNLGTYCFEAEFLRQYLPLINSSNAQQEFYLTEVIQLATQDGIAVDVAVCEEPCSSLGINTRTDLARVSQIMRTKICNHWMLEGVTLADPETTYIDATVTIGKDSVILPNTILEGMTVVGERCTIGPSTRIKDSRIADDSSIQYSVLLESEVGVEANIGPFAYLRPGTVIGNNVKIGDFVEVKSSRIGDGSKVPHLSYIGDADIGKGVNVGAGTITCNFDGVRKNHTEIADEASIGSNTNLVAPVRVGRGAKTGAGSVVLKDVPDYSLAAGVPAVIKKQFKPDKTE